MKGLEDEADRRAPETSKRMLAKLIQPGAVETKLTGRRPFQATEQVQQRRLATSARPHHRDRLAGDDVEIDTFDRSHERSTGAVLLDQPARTQDRLNTLDHRHSFALQKPAHASSQRRSACSLNTTPSSSSPATDSIGLSQRGPLRRRQRLQHRMPLRIDQPHRIGEPAAAAATSLR